MVKDLLALMNPTRWALLGGVLLALLGGAYAFHAAGVNEAREQGRAETRAAWLAAENAALREQQREISRLAGTVNNLNEVYRDQTTTIDRLSADLRARGLRVTKAERSAAIAAGTTEAVREYAATAADHFAACRSEYIDLGQGYAGCAATAQSLNKYADEVSGRPSRPSPPTPPTRP